MAVGTDSNHDASKSQGMRYSCDLCSYESTYESLLNQHKIWIYGIVDYPCDQCYYQGASQKLLQNHMSREHVMAGYSGDHYNQGTSQKPLVYKSHF